jgi:methyl-accepting chemotaxis protein
MKVSTRLALLTMMALLALLGIGGASLYELRQSMLNEKREQIVNLLEMANHLATYFHGEEVAGRMTTEQAQSATRLALNQLNYSATSFFWVRRPNGLTLVHRDPAVINKINMGRAPDGRPDGELYREMLDRERTPVMSVMAKYPGTNEMVAKLNGITEFKPWDWWIGTGAFTDDIDTTFWRIGGILIAMIALALTGIAAIAWRIIRKLTDTLGGEPDYAGEVVSRMAAGDFGGSIDLKPGDRGSLLASIAHMRQGMAETIVRIRSGSDAVMEGTGEIAAGNTNLSSRTEEQAASPEQTAASMDQLTTGVRQTSENARHARGLAENATTISAEGRVIVSEVVSKMADIKESSGKINEIIGIIEGIAFQTNILALNAAVEAARAGEQGRGFAVVAGEVRNLAQRSSAAAKDVKDLISASGSRVQEGAELVNRTGETMSRVSHEIQRVTDIMGEIATASHEQSRGIEEVNQAITQMDAVTQHNAALVEEVAAAANSLQDQAGQLRAAVAVFRV